METAFAESSIDTDIVPGNSYEWCVTSGKLDAAKWYAELVEVERNF